jgi:hypothetical protein
MGLCQQIPFLVLICISLATDEFHACTCSECLGTVVKARIRYYRTTASYFNIASKASVPEDLQRHETPRFSLRPSRESCTILRNLHRRRAG